MARLRVHIQGTDRVKTRMRRLAQSMLGGGRTGARLSAERVEKTMKRLVPVDTGRLRDSISINEVGKNRFEVGPSDWVEYAAYVEFGTRHTPAQPYVMPALERERSKFAQTVRGTINSEITW